MLLPPTFTWGGRVGQRAAEQQLPGIRRPLVGQRLSRSASRSSRAGTRSRSGYYQQHALKQQNQGAPFGTLNFGNDTNNPLDSQFGYANAALGIFSSYAQASKFVEGTWIYNNTEFYIQDNWKVSRPADARLRHALRAPAAAVRHDRPVVELPAREVVARRRAAAVRAGCANGVYPVLRHQPPGDESGDRPVPGAEHARSPSARSCPAPGNPTNGLFLSGPGHRQDDLRLADARPRAALRRGLRRDRPADGSCCAAAAACSSTGRAATRCSRRSSIRRRSRTSPSRYGAAADARHRRPDDDHAAGAQRLRVRRRRCRRRSSGTAACRWRCRGRSRSTSPTSASTATTSCSGVNLNAVDYGAAFLPKNQDPTLAPSTTPGATALSQDLMRAIRGYSSITQNHGLPATGRTTRSRCRSSAGSATASRSASTTRSASPISQNLAPRLQHAADGTFTVRSDQAEAEELLGNNNPQTHVMKANFVWDLPDLQQPATAHARGRPRRSTTGSSSGIWTGVDRQRLHRLGQRTRTAAAT